MIVSDEPVEGRLRAGLQLMDKIGFIAAPRKGTSPIGHCRPFRPAAEKRATLLNGPICSRFVSTNRETRIRTLDPGLLASATAKAVDLQPRPSRG
jgi:hypothetical protein